MKWDEMTEEERCALVAEKVMGWTKPRNAKYYVDHAGQIRTLHFSSFSEFVPSVYMDSAWEVVEKFLGYTIEKFISTQKFKVTVFTNEGLAYRALHKFAPEAICIAALQSVGVDIE